MLTIRMQRVGRRGHAQFRMVVQDSRFHPSSGRVVAYLGSYNPHTKAANFDKEKLTGYLANGAQPSARVVKILKNEKVKLPEWANEPAKKTKAVRNPEKRRSTRPEEPAEAKPAPPAEEATAAEVPAETDVAAAELSEAPQETAEGTTEETPVEAAEPVEETKPQEPKSEE